MLKELLKNGKNDKTIYEMEKFDFLYFFVKIKFREPPLKISKFIIKKHDFLKLLGIRKIYETTKDSKLKWFISTKAKFPNRFNCDNEFDVIYLFFLIIN